MYTVACHGKRLLHRHVRSSLPPVKVLREHQLSARSENLHLTHTCMLPKNREEEKSENPRTMKFSDRQLLNVAAYNDRHYAGHMPESTLLKLLVERGLTFGAISDEDLSARLAAQGFKPKPATQQPKKGK